MKKLHRQQQTKKKQNKKQYKHSNRHQNQDSYTAGFANNFFYLKDILKQRVLPNGRVQLFVSWEGWPSKYNSWVYKDTVMPVDQMLSSICTQDNLKSQQIQQNNKQRTPNKGRELKIENNVTEAHYSNRSKNKKKKQVKNKSKSKSKTQIQKQKVDRQIARQINKVLNKSHISIQSQYACEKLQPNKNRNQKNSNQLDNDKPQKRDKQLRIQNKESSNSTKKSNSITQEHRDKNKSEHKDEEKTRLEYVIDKQKYNQIQQKIRSNIQQFEQQIYFDNNIYKNRNANFPNNASKQCKQMNVDKAVSNKQRINLDSLGPSGHYSTHKTDQNSLIISTANAHGSAKCNDNVNMHLNSSIQNKDGHVLAGDSGKRKAKKDIKQAKKLSRELNRQKIMYVQSEQQTPKQTKVKIQQQLHQLLHQETNSKSIRSNKAREILQMIASSQSQERSVNLVNNGQVHSQSHHIQRSNQSSIKNSLSSNHHYLNNNNGNTNCNGDGNIIASNNKNNSIQGSSKKGSVVNHSKNQADMTVSNGKQYLIQIGEKQISDAAQLSFISQDNSFDAFKSHPLKNNYLLNTKSKNIPNKQAYSNFKNDEKMIQGQKKDGIFENKHLRPQNPNIRVTDAIYNNTITVAPTNQVRQQPLKRRQQEEPSAQTHTIINGVAQHSQLNKRTEQPYMSKSKSQIIVNQPNPTAKQIQDSNGKQEIQRNLHLQIKQQHTPNRFQNINTDFVYSASQSMLISRSLLLQQTQQPPYPHHPCRANKMNISINNKLNRDYSLLINNTLLQATQNNQHNSIYQIDKSMQNSLLLTHSYYNLIQSDNPITQGMNTSHPATDTLGLGMPNTSQAVRKQLSKMKMQEQSLLKIQERESQIQDLITQQSRKQRQSVCLQPGSTTSYPQKMIDTHKNTEDVGNVCPDVNQQVTSLQGHTNMEHANNCFQLTNHIIRQPEQQRWKKQEQDFIHEHMTQLLSIHDANRQLGSANANAENQQKCIQNIDQRLSIKQCQTQKAAYNNGSQMDCIEQNRSCPISHFNAKKLDPSKQEINDSVLYNTITYRNSLNQDINTNRNKRIHIGGFAEEDTVRTMTELTSTVQTRLYADRHKPMQEYGWNESGDEGKQQQTDILNKSFVCQPESYVIKRYMNELRCLKQQMLISSATNTVNEQSNVLGMQIIKDNDEQGLIQQQGDKCIDPPNILGSIQLNTGQNNNISSSNSSNNHTNGKNQIKLRQKNSRLIISKPQRMEAREENNNGCPIKNQQMGNESSGNNKESSSNINNRQSSECSNNSNTVVYWQPILQNKYPLNKKQATLNKSVCHFTSLKSITNLSNQKSASNRNLKTIAKQGPTFNQ